VGAVDGLRPLRDGARHVPRCAPDIWLRARHSVPVTTTGRATTLALAVFTVAACGSSGTRSPDRLFADAMTTLARSHSVHYREAQSNGRATNTSDSDATQNAVHTEARSSNGAWSEMVLVNGVLYDRGSYTGGRWWVMPDADRTAAEPTTIPGQVRCLQTEHGRLAAVGSPSGGHVVLSDDGNAPGASPGRWYLNTAEPVRLMRSVHTGPDRDGGPAHCGRTLAGVTIDASYSAYDVPVSVTAPTDAVPAPPGTQ